MTTAETSQPTGIDRRRSGRIYMRVPVRLAWREGDTQHYEVTSTICISAFGCSLESRHELQPSTHVMVEQNGKAMAGSVSYVLKSSAADHFELGIGFKENGSAFWGMTF